MKLCNFLSNASRVRKHSTILGPLVLKRDLKLGAIIEPCFSTTFPVRDETRSNLIKVQENEVGHSHFVSLTFLDKNMHLAYITESLFNYLWAKSLLWVGLGFCSKYFN